MTLRCHVTDFYMDGHIAISYCKVCSVEGDRLFEECKGPIKSGVLYFQNMTKEEFEEKYQKTLDEKM
jgi:hypothetical protein